MRFAIPVAALLISACHSPADAEAAHSALAEIETLRPVIACVGERVDRLVEQEVWAGGVPKGPAQSRETLKECAPHLRFDFGRSIEQRDPNAARDAVMFWALMSFGDYRDHLSVADFDSAIEAARCVEAKLVGNNGLLVDGARSEQVSRQAFLACVPGVAEIEANPSIIPSRRNSFAFSIAQINLNSILANQK